MNRTNLLHRRVQIVHDQMAAAVRLLQKHHPDQVDKIFASDGPYLQLLNRLYQDHCDVAKLMRISSMEHVRDLLS